MSKKNGDTVKAKNVIEVDSPKCVAIPLKTPDFHYSINHLEEERLLLQSSACGLEKSNREQFENKCGEQYELAKRLRDQAEEIERTQQILNDQERIFSDPKIAESISSFIESQKVKEENSKT